MNGDGFGVGWYDSVYDEESYQPCIFTSITPAWNNVNLVRLAEKIKSPLVFGHVRATTAGSLSLDNCHPFVHGRLMFMHNGGIADFPLVKRRLQADLPDVAFNKVQGNTDSEWAFALFLSKLPDPNAKSFTTAMLRDAMFKTIASLNHYAEEAGITEPSLMNFCVTDGETVIATRYISSKTDEAASLWYSSGTTFSEFGGGGHYKMSKADKRENIIMVASEPLTFERADWMEIKTNNMVVVTPKMNLLQIPIVDKFYVPPSDPASLTPGFSSPPILSTFHDLVMPSPLLWRAVSSAARSLTVAQILLFLPLTLSTLSTPAFSFLSLCHAVHAFIHGTLVLLWGSPNLTVLQLPIHPFLLLLCFNVFSSNVNPWILTASRWWAYTLSLWGPFFFLLEGLSSLIVAQRLGQMGKRLIEQADSEVYQFTLLVAAAVTYVLSAYWCVIAYPAAASSPLSSTFLGVALTALVFLTLIGFVLKKTNIIESSAISLFIAYNLWLCGVDQNQAYFPETASSYVPLIGNLKPHFDVLQNFVTNTLPKPLLITLVYRLSILQYASRILPTIGTDNWDSDNDSSCSSTCIHTFYSSTSPLLFGGDGQTSDDDVVKDWKVE
ncbi:glutamine amidotransferase [Lentinula edodes]|uniref:Glutamine amidotransferase n=1 Tax=Lentinula edodes TaxID=5353 RepID=A0A1Q3EFY0_LENED|nr:glutamine amidotransferase [Lentinula edodes]